MALPAPISGTFVEAAAAQLDGTNIVELTESLALEVDEDDYSVHGSGFSFLYSATATDNGIAGESSGEPGLIYEGPAEVWIPVTVRVRDCDVTEGTITPDAEDEVNVVCYVNSTPMIDSDESFVTAAGSEAVTEFNIDGVVWLTDGAVVRFNIITVEGDEGIIAQDWDVDVSGRWSLS